MKKVILYVLRGEENKTQHLANDRFDITIMTINPKTYKGCCGRRSSLVYLDEALLNRDGQAIIDTIIKPSCEQMVLM